MDKTKYLNQFIDLIDKSHQITHVCVPNISSNCITEEFINGFKDLIGLNITIIPFDPILFEKINERWSGINDNSNIKDGLYILIDSNNASDIMHYMFVIQRKINISIKHYKKINNIKDLDSCFWTMHYLSDKRHKWVGT